MDGKNFKTVAFARLREALAAFGDETQKTVTGTVKLKLYKGNFGRHKETDATDFINLFGLLLKVVSWMAKILRRSQDNA